MTFTLAFRNLFYDRIRLVVTLVGILFSIVLVAVQLGLYLGARTMIISMIDRADGDLWVMAYGTKNFEEAQPIAAREKIRGAVDAGRRQGDPADHRLHRLAQADGRIDACCRDRCGGGGWGLASLERHSRATSPASARATP